MLLLVGLGNPGPGYAGNRHNFGFMAVDEIARRHGFGPWRRRFQSDISEGLVGGVKILAQKPLSFMNRSGLPVAAAMRFYKLENSEVTVIHDELDISLGKVRVKLGGGHGGNNGLRDVSRHIGPDYRRVRLGIGHPGDKDLVEGHILSDFAKAERAQVDTIVDAVAEAFLALAEGDENGFMNKVALRVNPPKPKNPKPKNPKPEHTAETTTNRNDAEKDGSDGV
ncbi:MAG: aminoacyl-tRNA hydrolase [Alphaproteobacteria bacterium]|nr:aminoacyl-tRNA hydrolase [Alphaproteobacteria bacterium]